MIILIVILLHIIIPVPYWISTGIISFFLSKILLGILFDFFNSKGRTSFSTVNGADV